MGWRSGLGDAVRAQRNFIYNMLTLRLLRVAPVRRFSSAVMRLNEQKSSCAAGTVLNLKVRKNGDEPVALEDKDYPEWLWNLLDKQKLDGEAKEQDFMKWRKRQINKANTAKIKNNNFLSQM